MGHRRREAERNAGAFLGGSMMPIPAPVNALKVGPGSPGPGDDWHMPPEPIDEIDGKDDASIKTVPSDGTVSLPARPPFKPAQKRG